MNRDRHRKMEVESANFSLRLQNRFIFSRGTASRRASRVVLRARARARAFFRFRRASPVTSDTLGDVTTQERSATDCQRRIYISATVLIPRRTRRVCNTRTIGRTREFTRVRLMRGRAGGNQREKPLAELHCRRHTEPHAY